MYITINDSDPIEITSYQCHTRDDGGTTPIITTTLTLTTTDTVPADIVPAHQLRVSPVAWLQHALRTNATVQLLQLMWEMLRYCLPAIIIVVGIWSALCYILHLVIAKLLHLG